MSAILEIRHFKKYYESAVGITRAVEDISFTVRRSEFVSIVGPSGAGKTTLLRALAGLIRPTSGSILYEGQEVLAPQQDFAVVFQDYSRSLYPWFSAEKNVLLPLVNKIPDAESRRRIAQQTLEKVGLGDLGKKKPPQLSGGQQQRVAIARALAFAPKVLIMDEPFASVDAQTRADLEDLVLWLKAEHDTTILFVTHDVDEAVYMSNRVIVMTKSPSVVADDIAIQLPKERDQIATKALPEFASARAAILTLVRNALAPVAAA
ncbi:ABC transporter ATP-binding protein [Pseudochelatococcus sp. B33]